VFVIDYIVDRWLGRLTRRAKTERRATGRLSVRTRIALGIAFSFVVLVVGLSVWEIWRLISTFHP